MTSHSKEQPLGYCVAPCLTVNCLYCHGLLGPQGWHCPAHVATFKTPSGCHGEGVPAQPPVCQKQSWDWVLITNKSTDQWHVVRPFGYKDRMLSGGFKWETIYAPLTLTFCFFVLQRQTSGAAAGNNKTSGGQGKKSQNDMFVCFFLWDILGQTVGAWKRRLEFTV